MRDGAFPKSAKANGSGNHSKTVERLDMPVYKRGDTYWYEFQFNGERICERAGSKRAVRAAGC